MTSGDAEAANSLALPSTAHEAHESSYPGFNLPRSIPHAQLAEDMEVAGQAALLPPAYLDAWACRRFAAQNRTYPPSAVWTQYEPLHRPRASRDTLASQAWVFLVTNYCYLLRTCIPVRFWTSRTTNVMGRVEMLKLPILRISVNFPPNRRDNDAKIETAPVRGPGSKAFIRGQLEGTRKQRLEHRVESASERTACWPGQPLHS